MNCSTSHEILHDYVDGEPLAAPEVRALESHLAQCEACRRQLESLRALLAAAASLPKEIAPSRDLWSSLQLEMERPVRQAHGPSHRMRGPELVEGLDFKSDGPASAQVQRGGFPASRSTVRGSLLQWSVPLATAAAIVFLATLAERRIVPPDHGPAWSVANIAGAPRVANVAFAREASLRVGQWLETDAESRAKVTAGSVGEVTLDPNSRLRLTGMAATDHRVELARGTLHAFIWAPPRLFFVDTPAATAVDLGCAYTLAVDDRGDGELQVTFGYVALEHHGRESLVPAGARCLMRRDAGPGTPFAGDASEALRSALRRFDFEKGAAEPSLRTILTEARPDDGVTLWHLLARTEGAARVAVFDVLSGQHAPPTGVTRAGILAGDPAMRRSWGEALGLGILDQQR